MAKPSTLYYVELLSGRYMTKNGKRRSFLTRETAQIAANRVHGFVVSVSIGPPVGRNRSKPGRTGNRAARRRGVR